MCLVLPMVLTIVLTLGHITGRKAISRCLPTGSSAFSGTLSSFDVKSADMKKALLTALGYFVKCAGSFLAVMKREY